MHLCCLRVQVAIHGRQALDLSAQQRNELHLPRGSLRCCAFFDQFPVDEAHNKGRDDTTGARGADVLQQLCEQGVIHGFCQSGGVRQPAIS